MERLDQLNNYMLQRVKDEKGDEEQFLSFLNALLGRTDRNKLTSLTVRQEKLQSTDSAGDRTDILDIRATVDDGTSVNIGALLRNYGNTDTPKDTLKDAPWKKAPWRKTTSNLYFITDDTEALHRYEMWEMAALDYNSGMRSAWEEGMQEGMREQMKTFAIKMLRRKTPLDIIVEDTGLDEAVIQALQAELDR